VSISTHVLDAVTGRPAAGVDVVLSVRSNVGWRALARGSTDSDGRIVELAGDVEPGIYQLWFDIDSYLDGQTFYPEVVVVFRILDDAAHHHVPLLLSPYSYATYRGS
jgi:5-hydroxyisourate hydrolase